MSQLHESENYPDDTYITSTVDQLAICQNCYTSENVMCVECGLAYDFCECVTSELLLICTTCGEEFSIDFDDPFGLNDYALEDEEKLECKCIPIHKWYCNACGIEKDPATLEWRKISDKPKTIASSPPLPVKCRHYSEPVALPSGVVIHCSSLHNNRSDDSPAPDFGLYADFSWKPYWRNEFIDWPDFRIPYDEEIATEQIVDLYEKAKEQRVEIGCIGGHGRTGTILACLYTYDLDGAPTGEQSTLWVKKNYCKQAVETREQAWFVDLFRSLLFENVTLPERPTQSGINSYPLATNMSVDFLQNKT